MKFQFVPALSNTLFLVEILIDVFNCHDEKVFKAIYLFDFLDVVSRKGVLVILDVFFLLLRNRFDTT